MFKFSNLMTKSMESLRMEPNFVKASKLFQTNTSEVDCFPKCCTVNVLYWVNYCLFFSDIYQLLKWEVECVSKVLRQHASLAQLTDYIYSCINLNSKDYFSRIWCWCSTILCILSNFFNKFFQHIYKKTKENKK